ncbi:hypothetical protein P4O66_005341, partial [Electrophorus voltai]
QVIKIKDAMQKFCACECYYTDNIFIEEYKLHVRFVSEDQFRKDYQHILRSQGCTTGPQLHTVLEKVQAEVERRKNIAVQSAERRATIKETYKPLHENVYRLQESHLAPEFLEIVKYCHMDGANEKGLLALLTTEAAPRVYRFPVFTKDFCRDLVEELEHFEQSDAPKGRPNTMNNYGVLLDELGLDEGLVGPLREEYLRPLSALLYPDCGGRWLDSHKAFAVKYAVHEDVELSYHYDNAEVTLNVSLGKDFTGGNLYFGDMRQEHLKATLHMFYVMFEGNWALTSSACSRVPGAPVRDGVRGDGASGDAGADAPRAAHARRVARLGGLPMEPCRVDAGIVPAQPPLPHVRCPAPPAACPRPWGRLHGRARPGGHVRLDVNSLRRRTSPELEEDADLRPPDLSAFVPEYHKFPS